MSKVGTARYAVRAAERSVRRRNQANVMGRPIAYRSARYYAGGDIAARCPYQMFIFTNIYAKESD